MKKNKPTMSDIAKIAGVSQGTVSNALNNRKGSLSNQKRNEILKIAAEMGYARTKNYGLIRLIVFENEQTMERGHFNNTFFAKIFRHIQSECEANGYQLLISYAKAHEIESILQSDGQLNVAGVLVLGTVLKPEDFAVFENSEVPLVVLDTSLNGKAADFVSIDNFNGMEEIGNYVASRGHKIIGLANITPMITNFKERKNGLISALSDHEIIFDPDYQLDYRFNKSMVESITAYFKHLDQVGKPYPTAMVAMNDYIALEILNALKKLNLNMAVTGFDNIPLSEFSFPALTTIQVDQAVMAQSAVKRLVEKISGNNTSYQRIMVSTHLVIRDSVAMAVDYDPNDEPLIAFQK